MKPYLLAVILIMALITSCIPKDEECINEVQAPIEKVIMPDSGKANTPIPINIFFSVYNGCGNLKSVEETGSGNSRTISVTAAYQGCTCTQVAGQLEATHYFNEATKGVYYIQFLNSTITDTITIY